MNNKLRKFLKAAFWYLMFDGLILGYIGLIPGAQVAAAQTILTNTTLSAALQGMGSVNGATPTGNQSVVSVTSATGISAPAPNTSLTSGLVATSDAQSYLYVDRELMQVKAVSGTTLVVIRGVGSTSAPSHASGAVVFVIPSAAFGIWSGGGYFATTGPSLPQGSCTRTSEIYLPRIDFSSGIISDCLNGQWVNGDARQNTRNVQYRINSPVIGAVSTNATLGTNSTLTANSIYCTEIDMPYSKLVTGLAAKIGTTGGTDKWIVGLYDAGGNLITTSAVAGATVGATGNRWNQEAFINPYYVVGPAQYFGCVQTNGTTATLDTITTFIDENILAQSFTGTAFGTLPAFTPPTSFNSAKGPFLYVY